jgi:hypothetical protein
MKSIFIFLLFLLPGLVNAGQEVGKGGDAVLCRASNGNQFVGHYSLDFLAQFSKDSPIANVKSLEESLNRLEGILSANLPELLQSFRTFRRDLFNERDFSRTHIWDRAPYGLIDLKDEELTVLLPENCRSGDKTSVVQAAIRLPPAVSGLPQNKFNYKFVAQVVDELLKNNPVQLSFLLVHEWLWTFSDKAERNRRINYWLHSQMTEKWNRHDWVRNVHALGFVIPNMQPPVWEYGICELDQKSVDKVRAAVDGKHRKELFHAQGQAFKRTIKCPKNSNCVEQQWTDTSEELRRTIKGPINLVGYVSGLLPGINLDDASEKLFARCFVDDEKCIYTNQNDPRKWNFWVKPTLGKNCAVIRGRYVNEHADHNEIEEIVYYFAELDWVR